MNRSLALVATAIELSIGSQLLTLAYELTGKHQLLLVLAEALVCLALVLIAVDLFGRRSDHNP